MVLSDLMFCATPPIEMSVNPEFFFHTSNISYMGKSPHRTFRKGSPDERKLGSLSFMSTVENLGALPLVTVVHLFWHNCSSDKWFKWCWFQGVIEGFLPWNISSSAAFRGLKFWHQRLNPASPPFVGITFWPKLKDSWIFFQTILFVSFLPTIINNTKWCFFCPFFLNSEP